MTTSHFKKGVLFCLIAGICFGAQWPVAGRALKHIDPFFFTLIRYLIVAVVLSVILFFTEGAKSFKTEGKLVPIWFYGSMAFCAYNFLVFLGQKMAGDNGAILGSILMALIPMVSLLVLWVYKKNRPANVTLLLVAVSFIGVLLVVTKGDIAFFADSNKQAVPIILMSISVLAWVLYTIGGSSFPEWSSLRYTALSCIFGNITSIVVISIFVLLGKVEVPSVNQVMDIKWEMIYMSIFAGVIGVFAWNIGNKILTPINGSLFMNLVPIVSFIISIIAGYRMSPVEAGGAFLTIGAIVLNNFYQRRRSVMPAVKTSKKEAV
ncbi:DMT family transporter [Bacillus vallismortis]|uniref:DMT family transporter n=1 Tax=Bacillus vallismortis TaxID=72361 RepID=UPI0020914F09|nr:DMT family transporter [Bacillus vallismortis]MCO4851230.1 DMT family transporter [Bacillus vallismortis]